MRPPAGLLRFLSSVHAHQISVESPQKKGPKSAPVTIGLLNQLPAKHNVNEETLCQIFCLLMGMPPGTKVTINGFPVSRQNLLERRLFLWLILRLCSEDLAPMSCAERPASLSRHLVSASLSVTFRSIFSSELSTSLGTLLTSKNSNDASLSGPASTGPFIARIPTCLTVPSPQRTSP